MSARRSFVVVGVLVVVAVAVAILRRLAAADASYLLPFAAARFVAVLLCPGAALAALCGLAAHVFVGPRRAQGDDGEDEGSAGSSSGAGSSVGAGAVIGPRGAK